MKLPRTAIWNFTEKQTITPHEIAMTAVVTNTDKDLAIPYSNKNNICFV